MLAGMIVTAIPLTIVGNSFADAWNRRTLTLIGERLKQSIPYSAGQDISREVVLTWRVFDKKLHGSIDYHTFKHVISKELNLTLTNGQLRQAWKLVDFDEQGGLSFVEFAGAFFAELDEDDVNRAIQLTKEMLLRESSALLEEDEYGAVSLKKGLSLANIDLAERSVVEAEAQAEASAKLHAESSDTCHVVHSIDERIKHLEDATVSTAVQQKQTQEVRRANGEPAPDQRMMI